MKEQRRAGALSRGAQVAIALVAGSAGFVVALAACSQSEVRGPQAIVGWSNGGAVIVVAIDTCDGEPEADLVEEDDTVTVTVISTKRSPGDGCQDIVRIELSSDLGDRTVIDGVTGVEPPGIEG